jgi:hypothetical protein
MPVLFDPTDEYVSSVLELAKARGEISLADLEAIVEGGLEAKNCIEPDDIGDTIDALAAMGIEIDDGLTEEENDEEFRQGMQDWVDKGNMLPSLTAEGWASLVRAQQRRELVGAPSAEEVAERRAVLSKRTFVQNVFAHLGPRIRQERRGG